MVKKRKHYFCNFCEYDWYSSLNPKTCPKCKNPVGKKPKHNMRNKK